MTIDIYIQDLGSVVGFTPVTEAATAWFDENVETESWQWLGDTFYADHRPASHLIAGILTETDLITN